MKIAVTGAGGAIGSVLVPFLRACGHEVEEAPGKRELDLRVDVSGTRRWLEGVRPEGIVHLAGVKPPAGAETMLSTNAAATFTLLYAVQREAPLARIIVMSSAAAHGNPPTSYGLSKQIAEAVTEKFAYVDRLSICIARLFNVVGLPGDTTSVVPQMLQRFQESEQTFELRDADCVRDFIHASDVGTAVETLLTAGEVPLHVDVGTGIPTTISDVATTLAATLGAHVRFQARPFAGPGMKNSLADPSALRSLGWQACLTPLDAVAAAVRVRGLPAENQ